MEHDGDGDTNCYWSVLNGPQRLGKKIGVSGNQWKIRDHTDHSIVKIGQNTAKSPGNLRRLAVTQNPVKDHKLKFWFGLVSLPKFKLEYYDITVQPVSHYDTRTLTPVLTGVKNSQGVE